MGESRLLIGEASTTYLVPNEVPQIVHLLSEFATPVTVASGLVYCDRQFRLADVGRPQCPFVLCVDRLGGSSHVAIALRALRVPHIANIEWIAAPPLASRVVISGHHLYRLLA